MDAQSAARMDAATPPVVHHLSSLAETYATPLLVVGYGSPMKSIVKLCAKNECGEIWVTGTQDKERAFSCGGAARVAQVGASFDARLFSNAHAVMNAADACGATVLLACTEEIAADETLRRAAHQAGLHLMVQLPGDRSRMLWVECAPDPATADDPIAWRKCPKCRLQHDETLVLAGHGVCPTCGELYRLTSDERLAETFDAGSFQEWDAHLEENDPLAFPGFDDLIATQRARSGLDEGVRTGCARLDGRDVAVCIMESTFMMGSMGTVVGEKITRAVERATEERLPLVIFTASGGARMQEGLASLMQMGKISAALERHSRAGLLYVSVITDPTTGGVTASFAMQGDVIISEPHALIGFAGRRVIQDTIKQTLPEGFQTAEFALEHGLIDAIVAREDMRAILANVLSIHCDGPASRQVDAGDEARIIGADRPLQRLVKAAADKRSAKREAQEERASRPKGSFFLKRALRRRGVADAPAVKPSRTKAAKDDNPAWESVMRARNVHRPTAVYYIESMVDDFFELHGDRAFGDDGAIVGGIGWIDGIPVTVVAEEKGADLQQRIKRNFGCPQPEGYRKSLRLMRQAEKFGRPIVCLVDTQGAFCGMEAEERGQGNAIADNLIAMAGLTVPIVCVVLGEGGSGGALALAMGNRVAMQEYAVYSVLSPEGFASILWKDRTRAAEAAAVMKMSAAEACELGFIEEVVSEGAGPAHENPEQAASFVHDFVSRSLAELAPLGPEELRQQRYERFRAF